MRRITLIAIMSISIVANAVLAQQSAAKPETEERDSLPTVEEQLKVLNEKIGLTQSSRPRSSPSCSSCMTPRRTSYEIKPCRARSVSPRSDLSAKWQTTRCARS
jgi:hypothetical protein